MLNTPCTFDAWARFVHHGDAHQAGILADRLHFRVSKQYGTPNAPCGLTLLPGCASTDGPSEPHIVLDSARWAQGKYEHQSVSMSFAEARAVRDLLNCFLD